MLAPKSRVRVVIFIINSESCKEREEKVRNDGEIKVWNKEPCWTYIDLVVSVTIVYFYLPKTDRQYYNPVLNTDNKRSNKTY